MVSKLGNVAALIAVAAACILVTAGPASAVAPSNDNFADATVLSGPAGSVAGDTYRATSEAGENCTPFYGCSVSVWFDWTAPSSGSQSVTFSLCQVSHFDTILEVYTGSVVVDLGDLTLVAWNDDACLGIQSEVTFAAVPGVTYHIRVGGHGGDRGFFQLDYPTSVVDTDGDGLADDQDPDTIGAIVADPSISIGAGNRRAFLGRLDRVEILIVSGDTATAIAELDSLRKRVDGCGNKADTNDWVANCTAQLSIRTRIDSLITNLVD